MKKLFAMRFSAAMLAALSIGLSGCTADADLLEPAAPNEPTMQTMSANAPAAAAVFDESSSKWARHQNDPYTLDNFRQAYENLLASGRARGMTQAQVAGLADISLEATHYNVKIFPKTEQEQWELEHLEDVNIVYLPFEYAQLSDDETTGMNRSVAKTILPDERKYTVTYDDGMTTEGPAAPVSITMPVLYAVWPVNKSFPADMDYEIMKEVFIPEDAPEKTRSSSSNVMQLLENEAINLASGRRSNIIIKPIEIYQTIRGQIHCFDNTVNREVPIENLLIRIQLGSKIWETYTNSESRFEVRAPVNFTGGTVSYIYMHDNWKITTEDDDTLPFTTTWGIVDAKQPFDYVYAYNSPIFEVHRAINYYYNGSHTGPKQVYPGGIRLVANSQTSPKGYGGLFYYFWDAHPYVEIFNVSRTDHAHLMGIIFHELGHFSQFQMKGGTANMYITRRLIKESYADYIGWYLSESYYYNYLNCNKPKYNNGIANIGRQSWVQTSLYAPYSPLFIDLVDSYNQKTSATSTYNYDVIEKFPASIIHRIATQSADWPTCKRLLQEYIGYYYTSADFNGFAAPYDYYDANNPVDKY